jgi:hypothetical protein
VNTCRWSCSEIQFVGVALLLAGCGPAARQASAEPVAGIQLLAQPQPQFVPPPPLVTPLVTVKSDLPVVEGVMPLVYLVESDGDVRVTDATAGHLLARRAAPARTIVSVDPQRGVSIGDQLLAPGPLPADHRYSIYFAAPDAGQSPEIRSSAERNDPPIAHDKSDADRGAVGNGSAGSKALGHGAASTAP